jgi:hypothetical protein
MTRLSECIDIAPTINSTRGYHHHIGLNTCESRRGSAPGTTGHRPSHARRALEMKVALAGLWVDGGTFIEFGAGPKNAMATAQKDAGAQAALVFLGSVGGPNADSYQRPTARFQSAMYK